EEDRFAFGAYPRVLVMKQVVGRKSLPALHALRRCSGQGGRISWTEGSIRLPVRHALSPNQGGRKQLAGAQVLLQLPGRNWSALPAFFRVVPFHGVTLFSPLHRRQAGKLRHFTC